jgi:predicted transposase/invertase (TIGR01784 family)
VKGNRNYKDSVFTKLFNDKKNLAELLKALTGKNYNELSDIRVNTLSDVLYMNQINDLSCIAENELVVLLEHQSTLNKNMPLRLLMYLARVYEKIINEDPKRIYRSKLIKVPEPLLIVLYDGTAPFPYPGDVGIMKLSDAFLTNEYKALEMKVRIVNINKGHNKKLHDECRALAGFSELISKVNELRGKMPLDEAMKKGIRYCIDNGFIPDFLRTNASEVENMLYTHFELDKALQAARDDAWEDALEEGETKGKLEGRLEGKLEGRLEGKLEAAKAMLDKGLDVSFISEITRLSTFEIEALKSR